MSESLNEILERLNWARGETKAIEGEIKQWVNDNFDAQLGGSGPPNMREILIEAKEPIPIGIRARTGTTTNEIRSCLDSLASALAERNGDDGGAYFPVANHEAAFDNDPRLKRRLTKFRTEDRDALLAFRPFAFGKDGEPGNLLLYGLHHADIKRKHHRLVAKSARTGVGFGIGYVGRCLVEPRKLAMPGITAIGFVSENTTAQLRFLPHILYSEPDVLRGREVIKTLDDFADIAETIVRAFL